MEKSVEGKLIRIGIPILLGLIVSFVQPPEGLSVEAMRYIGIFVCVVGWLLVNAVPDWAAFLTCISAYIVFNVTNFSKAVAPFADTTIWLLIGCMGMSIALISTGLVKRLAFAILSLFPESYRGQIAAFFTAGFVVTPFIPAKIGKGLLMVPVAAAAAKALGYPARSKAATGLFLTIWATTGILSYAFVTGAAPVMIIIGLMPAEQQGLWTWMQWFLACLPWLLIVGALSIVAILVLYNPKKDKAGAVYQPQEKGFAKTQLKAMGPMSRNEIITAVLLIAAVVGWIFGSRIGLGAPVIAMSALAILAILGLVTTQEFVSKIPWDTVVFIGGILSLASLLTELGISRWLAEVMAPLASPIAANPFLYVTIICLLTYIIRLGVVSSIATVVIFMAALGTIAAYMGIDLYVTLFVCLCSTAVWHLKFTNNEFIPLLSAQAGEMCEHNDTMPYNFAYMVINLVACLASVPVWQMMGLIV